MYLRVEGMDPPSSRLTDSSHLVYLDNLVWTLNVSQVIELLCCKPQKSSGNLCIVGAEFNEKNDCSSLEGCDMGILERFDRRLSFLKKGFSIVSIIYRCLQRFVVVSVEKMEGHGAYRIDQVRRALMPFARAKADEKVNFAEEHALGVDPFEVKIKQVLDESFVLRHRRPLLACSINKVGRFTVNIKTFDPYYRFSHITFNASVSFCDLPKPGKP